MKYMKIRSIVFDVPDMLIAPNETIPGASKSVVTLGLREDGKMFWVGSTLRADRLADWEYVKSKQKDAQTMWDLIKDGYADIGSISIDEFDVEFASHLAKNQAVEVPTYVQ